MEIIISKPDKLPADISTAVICDTIADITTTVWLSGKGVYRSTGGTGSGIRLLFDFLKKI